MTDRHNATPQRSLLSITALLAELPRLLLILGAVFALTLRIAVSQSPAPSATTHEEIEWLDEHVEGTNSPLPHVLLIGDSITRNYVPFVQQRLAGRAAVSYLATSKCAGDPILTYEVSSLLRQYRFNVIHFSNGLHSFSIGDADYEIGMRQVLSEIKAVQPQAILILASSTPIIGEHKDPNEIVIRRNRIVSGLATQMHLQQDDMYSFLHEHPEFYGPDGVHPIRIGAYSEGERVSQIVANALQIKAPLPKETASDILMNSMSRTRMRPYYLVALSVLIALAVGFSAGCLLNSFFPCGLKRGRQA